MGGAGQPPDGPGGDELDGNGIEYDCAENGAARPTAARFGRKCRLADAPVRSRKAHAGRAPRGMLGL